MNIQKLLKELTLEEKIAFCTGADFWHTKAIEKQNVPGIMMSDGPHGLRCQAGDRELWTSTHFLLYWPCAVSSHNDITINFVKKCTFL